MINAQTSALSPEPGSGPEVFHRPHPPGLYTTDASWIIDWLRSEGLAHSDAGMIDVGCNNGLFVQAWLNKIGPQSRGVDWHNMISDLVIPREYFFVRDLRVPVPDDDDLLDRRYDIVMCLEVGEHLPAKSAPVLVGTCAQFAQNGGSIVWSAATPGQGGHRHINEQPHAFWHRLFAAHGFLPRPVWRGCNQISPWYSKNAFIYSSLNWRA